MGNPSVYYKRALQCFAYCLAYEENVRLAKELDQEESDEKLEQFILEKKAKMSEKKFFFDAGRACEATLGEAYQEGCDALNASIGGLHEFKCFIGLQDDEEDS